MKEESQIHPLVSASVPPPPSRGGASKPFAAPMRRSQRSSRCMVYALVLFVILCVMALIVGGIVYRLKAPEIEVPEIRVKSLLYDFSAARPFWEAAMAARVAIRSRNFFGKFEYDQGSLGRVMYGNKTVGEFKVGKVGSVPAKGEGQVGVTVKVSSTRLGKGYNGNWNNGELYSGRLKLGFWVKMRGTQVLVKVLKVRKSAELSCSFTLDFANRNIQDLFCSSS